MNNTYARVETEIGGRPVILETGQVARQAHGSVIATLGGTKAFAAISIGPAREEADFFPLTVDYREKTESAGKIPGGFFKREGRPTTKEILTMRLIDRSIRPLFPDGFRQEVQVMSHVLCYDGESSADLAAMIASFAAVRISGVPFDATLGAARIGHLDGKLVAFPSDSKRREESRLDLVVAGHKDGIAMVEAGARELSEEEMIDALELGQEVIGQIVRLIEELAAKAGKPPMPWTPPVKDEVLAKAVDAFNADLEAVIFTEGKHARSSAIDAVRDRCVEKLTAGITDADEKSDRKKKVKAEFGELSSRVEREMILRGKRVDGRKQDEIREITIVPNFIPRQHGSVLFTRSEREGLGPGYAMAAMAILAFVIGYQNLVTVPKMKGALQNPHVMPWASENVGTWGASGPTIGIPPGQSFLLFVRIPPEEGYARYTADLYNPSGKLEWSLTFPATAGQDQWPMQVPGTDRQAGTYTLKVRGNTAAGESRDLGRTSFDLQIQN
jgi:polyribonucleotide nucleotidyltransferase